ncbi:CDAC1 protein, partial [Atractosteus spatula]|nr:CDAC1 protein [Atractosteus spatula]
MAASAGFPVKMGSEENRAGCSCKGHVSVSEASTQTDTKVQGHIPRLSKANLFTLLSLWMELYPKNKKDQENGTQQIRTTGLVVVNNRQITGLHCSSTELHAGQIAVIKHGPRLKDCDLYFSRKPCCTCLKMIINAGVNRIVYWPADPEMSLLGSKHRSWDAALDASAAERLKSNSRPHICVLLQPLASNMHQYVEETSKNCDFLGEIACENPKVNVEELFAEHRRQKLADYLRVFFIPDEAQHKEILKIMGLQNLCCEPYYSSLRQHMRDLLLVLATVGSSVPQGHGYGFYCRDVQEAGENRPQGLSQDIARHCVVQARLLAYRTEDPKVGVGAVIWAEGKSSNCDGTGRMYLVGCGYNAFPVGSEYAEFPQMDDKQRDRETRKYRYIIHAEQNALLFRSKEIKEEENTMIFITKCPCDECVPLIKGSGIKQIYTVDRDSGKDKDDISYLRFDSLQGLQKFTVS